MFSRLTIALVMISTSAIAVCSGLNIAYLSERYYFKCDINTTIDVDCQSFIYDTLDNVFIKFETKKICDYHGCYEDFLKFNNNANNDQVYGYITFDDNYLLPYRNFTVGISCENGISANKTIILKNYKIITINIIGIDLLTLEPDNMVNVLVAFGLERKVFLSFTIVVIIIFLIVFKFPFDIIRKAIK